MKILSNHYTEESAFIIENYPFGFKLRCKKRVWLEVNSKGTRMISRTTNPKKSLEVWNAPKMSTYSIAGALYQIDESDSKPDEIGHVHWAGVSMYDLSKMEDFLNTYRVGLTAGEIDLLERYVAAHKRREAQKEITSE